MNFSDYTKFANENPICSLATVENDEPRVRILGFWFADETGFYFQTSTVKEITHQLKTNPNAEACFYKPGMPLGTMMRVNGKIEFITDQPMKEKVLKERPFLKSFGLTVDSPELTIFRIAHGKAHFWTMANNLKPKDYIKF